MDTKDKATIFTFTQAITGVANLSSDIIALEDSKNISVQFVCPSVPGDADFDASVMQSNDGTTWFYTTGLTTGNTLFSANFPDDAKLLEFTCYSRFIKVFIENYTEATGPTILTTTICIKD